VESGSPNGYDMTGNESRYKADLEWQLAAAITELAATKEELAAVKEEGRRWSTEGHPGDMAAGGYIASSWLGTTASTQLK